jgi:hypothetical protein
MWLVGTVAVVVIACLITFFIARHWPLEEKRPIWDLARAAGTYTSIVGTLAGFSVASSFFLANLSRSTRAPELETVIGMLVIAFLVLVGTAMTYGAMPTYSGGHTAPEGSLVDDKFVTVQKLIFLLGHTSYYIGIALAWLALRPLTVALGLQTFASILTWLLLFFVIAGAGRLGMHFYSLIGGNRLATTLMPCIGIVLTSLYRLVAVPIVPALWPAFAPVLSYAVVAFALSFVGFTSSSLLIYVLASPGETPHLRRRGHQFILFFIQAVCCSIALLWYSVALP